MPIAIARPMLRPLRTAALATLACVLPLCLSAPVAAQSGAPVITYFVCPLNIEHGNFECEVGYASATPAKVSWSVPGSFTTPPGSSNLFGHCTPGRPYRVSVTIYNVFGSATQTTTLNCV